MRGLRFCASALKFVAVMLFTRTSAGVGVEDVEDVEHQPDVRHAAAERPRNPEVGVPQVRIAERVDLAAEEDRDTGIAAQRRRRAGANDRERIALSAEHVGAQLDAGTPPDTARSR